MEEFAHSCLKTGDGNTVVKNGKSKNGKQRYKCKACGSRFLTSYSYKAYLSSTNSDIKELLVEGSGIRSISRLLQISSNTVMNRILQIASRIRRPYIYLGKQYELDEMCSFIGNKDNRIWIAYAIRKDTREWQFLT